MTKIRFKAYLTNFFIFYILCQNSSFNRFFWQLITLKKCKINVSNNNLIEHKKSDAKK